MANQTKTTPPVAPKDTDEKVGWVYDAGMELHRGDENHVEGPKRITTIRDALESQGLAQRCYRIPSRQAADDELLRCHPAKHIADINGIFAEAIAAGGLPNPRYLDGKLVYDGHIEIEDSSIFASKDTAMAARLSAGCVIQATRSVVSGEVAAALAVVRPPGHHAECDRAMGFCFFCNCAVAARDAIATSEGKIKKVLILDWDVHHGNGIQDCLYDDPNVLYISIHRDPSNFYPYTAGFMKEVGRVGSEGEGFNINIPWRTRGAGDLDYQAAFDIIEPVVKSYNPDLVIVAAGYDAAEGDPLGGCLVSSEGYAWMTRKLQSLCPKIVLALEGGYNNRVTAECVCACLRVLLGESESDDKEEDGVEDLFAGQAKKKKLLPTTIPMLKEVCTIQKKYWPELQVLEEKWEAVLAEGQKLEYQGGTEDLASILGSMQVKD